MKSTLLKMQIVEGNKKADCAVVGVKTIAIIVGVFATRSSDF